MKVAISLSFRCSQALVIRLLKNSEKFRKLNFLKICRVKKFYPLTLMKGKKRINFAEELSNSLLFLTSRNINIFPKKLFFSNSLN